LASPSATRRSSRASKISRTTSSGASSCHSKRRRSPRPARDSVEERRASTGAATARSQLDGCDAEPRAPSSSGSASELRRASAAREHRSLSRAGARRARRGWARLSLATPDDQLDLGLARLSTAVSGV
jgi:hypothetical protein